ncbi:MAG TPA: cupin domain-containing protein [Candidatus Acidoferrales bacterium]|nr:cupin domain-containing protein [Candidatus Acidoferrales bacterium]
MKRTPWLLLAFLAFCVGSFAAGQRAEINNAYVHVIHGTDAPHVKSAPHRHEFNRVMIYLDAGEMTITPAQGPVEQQHWKAGDVAWSPARGLHTSENVGTAPLRMIEIELKKPGPAVAPRRNPKLDPLVIDPRHYALLFENRQVRVMRSWREPGGTEPLHEHTGAGRVTVFLTNLDTTTKAANGKTSTQHQRAGDATWSAGSVIHRSTNAGKNRLEVIVVEVK